MSTERASPALIEQRIRNRLIEWLELVVESEHAAPAYGIDELLNDWQDWNGEPLTEAAFPPPTYTAAEVATLPEIERTWNLLCDATPKSIQDEAAAMKLPEWRSFVDAARHALNAFSVRGKLLEEKELDGKDVGDSGRVGT